MKKIVRIYIDRDVDDYFELERLKGDKERLAAYGETWHMTVIRAIAVIGTSRDGRMWVHNDIHSDGKWDVESDADETYLNEVKLKEVALLREILLELGFSQKEIDSVKVDDWLTS